MQEKGKIQLYLESMLYIYVQIFEGCNFHGCHGQQITTKISSSKHHCQNFNLDQLESRIHVNSFVYTCKG